MARAGDRPDCHPDGTYAPVQCHEETGYCWCVTAQGRPLPDTSVKNERPLCSKFLPATVTSLVYTRIATKKGEKRQLTSWKQKRQYASRHRNTCDRVEKTKFNSNLIDNFKIEYRRTNLSTNGNVIFISTCFFVSPIIIYLDLVLFKKSCILLRCSKFWLQPVSRKFDL